MRVTFTLGPRSDFAIAMRWNNSVPFQIRRNTAAIRIVLEKLGYTVPEEERDEVYSRFLEVADQKKEVYDEDLMRIVGMVEVSSPTQHYTLEDFEVVVGGMKRPQARVRLRVGKNETVSSDNVTGDGPVDAIYRSIDHAIGRPFNLHSYQLRSITEGQDALGEVLVQISFAGRLFTGRATSTDILRASAEAYIDAINHVETHRAGDQYVIGAIMDAYTYGPEEKW